MQQFFFSFTIYFIKTSNMSHCYLNLRLPRPIFRHSLLNLWPYAPEMWEPVYLCGTTQQISVATMSWLRNWFPRRFQINFRGLHLSKDWKMIVVRNQFRAVRWMRQDSPLKLFWWPLAYADVCGLALSWWRSTFVASLWGRTLWICFFRVST
jgi:hypothetical protein